MRTETNGTPAVGRVNGTAPQRKDWADLPEWITTDEAAEISGYHPEHVRWLARRGKIGAEKKGRDWWIDRDKLREYLASVEALGTKKYDPRGAPELAQHEDE